MKCTDGTNFYGGLLRGQTFIKGGRERVLVKFTGSHVWFKTKKDLKNNTVSCVQRNSFREWVTHRDVRLKVGERDE